MSDITFEEKLEQIRGDLKHLATLLIASDDTNIAQLALVAEDAVSSVIGEIEKYGLHDNEWKPVGRRQ